MKYLIILAVILILTSKNNGVKNLLNQITLDQLEPILNMLGIDSKITQFITQNLPNLLEDNVDLTGLIKNIMPIIASINANSQQPNKTIIEDEKLTPVRNFVPPEIFDDLNNYFE